MPCMTYIAHVVTDVLDSGDGHMHYAMKPGTLIVQVLKVYKHTLMVKVLKVIKPSTLMVQELKSI